jgi:DNA primase
VLSLQGDAFAHYGSVLPLIDAAFHGVPLVWVTYPNAPCHPERSNVMLSAAEARRTPVFHGPLRDRVQKLPTVEVPLAKGPTLAYFALQPPTVEWLLEYHHAIEFHSWTPTTGDPTKLRYARILLETGSLDRGPHPADTRDAAIVLRALLRERGVQAIPLLDGNGGVALYIPFDDAPAYPDVRRWLHVVANNAAARHPDLFTTEPNSAGGSRVHVHVRNNAPGLCSALPYSLRGPEGRCAVAPVTWDELAAFPSDHIEIETPALLERLRDRGDLFALQRDTIGPQRFADLPPVTLSEVEGPPSVTLSAVEGPHGHVLNAALEILADGHSRSAEDLLKEGIARGLLAPTTSYRYVYNALVEYINRNVARERKAKVVQNPDRTFRINEPLDDWPDVDLPQVPPPDDETKALIARLRSTVSGTDPAAWEAAVCDAFGHIGFRATHLGGHKAPDGYVDACLGPLGYRAMLECKTGGDVVPHPDVAEAAKWIEKYLGQFNALVGPGYPEETELHDELLLHRVSAWTIDDLCTALEKRVDALELRACFAPGYAGDAMVDVLWERNHGERKRVLYAAETIAREGWAAQTAAAAQADPTNAAHLTIDAAMLLVQTQLTRAGAERACTRAEAQQAFEYLTNPIVGKAVLLDASHDGIVIAKAPPSP